MWQTQNTPESQGALVAEVAEVAAEAEAGAADAIPAGADAGASTGVPGALATTDADGSDGSEAGVATALAGAVVENSGAASGVRFEQAENARASRQAEMPKADFIERISKPATLLRSSIVPAPGVSRCEVSRLLRVRAGAVWAHAANRCRCW